jgi:alpha-amylase
MGVILQGVYRRQADPTISVPAPRDHGPDDPPIPHWYDHLAAHAAEYAKAGITHLQLPPVSMCSGDWPTQDGYGVFNEYDLGSPTRPTRFGHAEILQRLCAILHANGITPLTDWVPHQRSGSRKSGIYDYVSTTGKPGRFPKVPSCFRERYPGEPGRVHIDPVAGPLADQFPFGDPLAHLNGLGPKGEKNYVINNLIDAGDWLYRRLDLGGCRNDCTKGQAFESVRRWGTSKAMKGKVMIGEYAEGNRDTLGWWVRTLGFQFSTYDFEFKYRARDMCNNASRFDMRRWRNSGLASLGWPYSMCSVTFIENADSDTNGFGAAVFNKLLAYAMMLTMEGWPSIYYRDYAKEKDCYGHGMKDGIDNLIWIHENIAQGETIWRAAEYQYLVMERTGGPRLLCGFNNDSWGGSKRVYVKTGFGPNVHLHDYTGHGPDVWTDWQGGMLMEIPENDNGSGYCCYSVVGLSKPNTRNSWPTTQEFDGADDLDIPPARMNDTTSVTRIWVAQNAEVKLRAMMPTAIDGMITPTAVDRNGDIIAPNSGNSTLTFKAPLEGWYRLRVTCSGSRAYPADTTVPFTLRATYTSTQYLEGS